jgi:transposase
MIPVSPGISILIATGDTEMLRGINLFALQVQQGLGRAPHAGELIVFRGRRGDLGQDPVA